MPDSIFTKIIKREIPSAIVYEDDEFIAFKDIHPQAPIHVLLVTKEPYESLESLPMENVVLQAKLLQTARRVAKQLKIEKDYKLFLNVGEHVQEVHHLHIHILGGWNFEKEKKRRPLFL